MTRWFTAAAALAILSCGSAWAGTTSGVTGTLDVTQVPAPTTSNDLGGTIATGGTWQEWDGTFPRVSCFLQNTDPTETLAVAIQALNPNSNPSHPGYLSSLAGYSCLTAGKIEQQHIWIKAATTGHTFGGWGT